jgi:hypothetical protein
VLEVGHTVFSMSELGAPVLIPRGAAGC